MNFIDYNFDDESDQNWPAPLQVNQNTGTLK